MPLSTQECKLLTAGSQRELMRYGGVIVAEMVAFHDVSIGCRGESKFAISISSLVSLKYIKEVHQNFFLMVLLYQFRYSLVTLMEILW